MKYLACIDSSEWKSRKGSLKFGELLKMPVVRESDLAIHYRQKLRFCAAATKAAATVKVRFSIRKESKQ